MNTIEAYATRCDKELLDKACKIIQSLIERDEFDPKPWVDAQTFLDEVKSCG